MFPLATSSARDADGAHAVNDSLQMVQVFATSLALGLLLGLERQRAGDHKAGMRTFALIALAGTLSAVLTQESGSGWLMAAALLVLGGMMIAADLRNPHSREDPATTTIAAVVVCFGLGAMLGYGHARIAVALGLATVALLYFKAELHGVSRRLSRQDIVSFLQFAAISFVVLPVLPDRGFGPHEALNPYRIWLMVALICGVSLAGYAALRLTPERIGPPLVGALGGIASSTATTLVFARRARDTPAAVPAAALVVLMASLTVPGRIAVIAGAVAPGLWRELLPMLLGGVAAGSVAAILQWRALRDRKSGDPLEVGNPTELRSALLFGALYGLILVGTATLNERAGAAGVYAVALVSGLVDLDAISLSSFQLFRGGRLDAGDAAGVVLTAFVVNLLFKAALSFAVAGRRLGLRVLPGFAAIAGGMVVPHLAL